jgi:PAS domain S-box-containing protein
MPPPGPEPSTDPYRDAMVRRVAARAPLAFGVFLACLALSTVFEVLRFPERQGWMLLFAAGFTGMVAIAWTLVRLRPTWSVAVMIAFVNVVGVGLNAYHEIVGAALAMCIWQLTALLATSAVLFPWGRRSQALASIGTLLSYPVHLASGNVDPLTWGAGATYLLIVFALGMSAASLFAGYVRTDLRLTAALSEREARLQSYFDLSLVGTAILSADGVCEEVNDELCRMLGYARGELLGGSWSTFLHPDDRDDAATLQAAAQAGGSARRDVRCVRRDGAAVDAILSLRGLPATGRAAGHVMVLVHDITERKRAEAEREALLRAAEEARHRAEEASRAKDAFLAMVSHELRTPLTPILAWSAILRDGNLDPRTDSALAAIERNARTQARMIDDLLDASRIVSGGWRLELAPVDMAPIVRAALDVVGPAAEAKGIALEATLPGGALQVHGDAARLQQVVSNLLANAVEFTPRGGRVAVALEKTGNRARVSVHDTGEGIDPEFLPHVFERFRQADGSATRRHGGLGLGLAIVHALVEAHGGAATAESEGAGAGATFRVELPLVSAVPLRADALRPRSVAVADALHGLHVLVVDDDADSSAVAGALLVSYGADVRTASSAADALLVARRWPVDIVVSDVAMPGEDGCALIRALRAGTRAHVPAVAVTALAGSDDRARIVAADFEACVVKPFDPTELVAVVRRIAGGRARLRA